MRQNKNTSKRAKSPRKEIKRHSHSIGKNRAKNPPAHISTSKAITAFFLVAIAAFSLLCALRASSRRPDTALLSRTSELAHSLRIPFDNSTLETLAYEVVGDLEKVYKPKFLQTKKEDFSHYIIDMYRIGWTPAKYELFKQTFEEKIKSSNVPEEVLSREIAINISSKSPVIVGESPNTKSRVKHCFVELLFYGNADFYTEIAKSCAEHELRHLGMNQYYTGNFGGELPHNLVIDDVIAKCSDIYQAMSSRNLERDLAVLLEKYRHKSFERTNLSQPNLMTYLIEEMMIVATGEMGNGIGKGLARGEMVGIRLNATKMYDRTPLAQTTMLQYAYFYSLMEKLGGTPQNSNLMKLIGERINSSQIRNVKQDFAIAVNIFEVVYDFAKSNLADAFRVYPNQKNLPTPKLVAFAN